MYKRVQLSFSDESRKQVSTNLRERGSPRCRVARQGGSDRFLDGTPWHRCPRNVVLPGTDSPRRYNLPPTRMRTIYWLCAFTCSIVDSGGTVLQIIEPLNSSTDFLAPYVPGMITFSLPTRQRTLEELLRNRGNWSENQLSQ